MIILLPSSSTDTDRSERFLNGELFSPLTQELVTSQKMGTRIAYNPVGLRPGTRPPRRHSSVAYRDTSRVSSHFSSLSKSGVVSYFQGICQTDNLRDEVPRRRQGSVTWDLTTQVFFGNVSSILHVG